MTWARVGGEAQRCEGLRGHGRALLHLRHDQRQAVEGLRQRDAEGGGRWSMGVKRLVTLLTCYGGNTTACVGCTIRATACPRWWPNAV